MYIGERHTASALGFELVKRTCSACGHQGVIEVAASGAGTAHSPFFLDAGADERAAEYARESVSRDAEMSAGLLPCPKCGGREPAARRMAIARSCRPLLLLFPLTLVPAFFLLTSLVASVVKLGESAFPYMGIGAVLALLVALGVAALVVRRGVRRLLVRAQGAASWEGAS